MGGEGQGWSYSMNQWQVVGQALFHAMEGGGVRQALSHDAIGGQGRMGPYSLM